MNGENKKNIESNLFWGDSNLPTFLKGDIPSNLTQPTNHQPISHGVSQRALASLSSATLAKSSLERVPGVPTKRRNVASFSPLPGAMVLVFCCRGEGAGSGRRGNGGEVLNEVFEVWKPNLFLFAQLAWGRDKLKLVVKKNASTWKIGNKIALL